MKRVAIEIDGVLRDTFAKLEQIYQKFLIDELELVDEDFKFEIKKPFESRPSFAHFLEKYPIKNKTAMPPVQAPHTNIEIPFSIFLLLFI